MAVKYFVHKFSYVAHLLDQRHVLSVLPSFSLVLPPGGAGVLALSCFSRSTWRLKVARVWGWFPRRKAESRVILITLVGAGQSPALSVSVLALVFIVVLLRGPHSRESDNLDGGRNGGRIVVK